MKAYELNFFSPTDFRKVECLKSVVVFANSKVELENTILLEANRLFYGKKKLPNKKKRTIDHANLNDYLKVCNLHSLKLCWCVYECYYQKF